MCVFVCTCDCSCVKCVMCMYVHVFRKKRQCLSDPQANAERTDGPVETDSQMNNRPLSDIYIILLISY